VKPIKMLGLAALAALLAMAFVGASSAMAEETRLCNVDECEEAGNVVTHVHETTLSGHKAVLLSEPEVKCDVLFLGDTAAGGAGAPLAISGNFTYSNCEGGCTASEENAPTEIKILKTGEELATVTSGEGAGAGLVHLVCFGFINCRYVGSGLVGHALGALTSSETNGSVTLSGQEVERESGSLCPETGALDITTTPLEKVYIRGPMRCVSRVNSLWANNAGGGECSGMVTPPAGNWALIFER
jgi:hypothetical protein